MSVTVYSQPACPQCRATYRALDREGIPYAVVNLADDVHALEQVRALGYRQAPVVVTESEHWSGFRPDRIAALTRARLAA
ncbi:MAG: glutaredoxin-like protein NrdH [Bifidobacteriaceae bacterium]|jgi:glutaredoxin-like protein NrdH|nr:glutaredoxin-like protein NrdH [Bifidobacteriaceae bacterium]